MLTSKKELFELFETMIKKPFGTKNSSKGPTVNGTKNSKGPRIDETKNSSKGSTEFKRFHCK